MKQAEPIHGTKTGWLSGMGEKGEKVTLQVARNESGIKMKSDKAEVFGWDKRWSGKKYSLDMESDRMDQWYETERGGNNPSRASEGRVESR
jgi:hypothetical protein